MKTPLFGSVALLLFTASAFAADVGAPANAPSGAAAFTSTGCYVGGRVSGGWGRRDVSDTVGILSPTTGFTSASLATSGYLLGGQIGCDDQFAPDWVIGIQGAAAGGRIGGSNVVAQPLALPGDNATFNETTDFLSSATARVGYASDRWLLYVRGGAGRATGTT